MLTVLLGGARSGKSALAVELARRHGNAVTYVATSPEIPGDDDLAERVARHRAERPPEWTTIEEETDLAGALAAVDTSLVVVDCLTVWVGNLLHHGLDEPHVIEATVAAIDVIGQGPFDAVVISNEVGLGIVPVSELARTYRDLLGRVNQRWVTAADHAVLMVAGRAVPLHDPHELLR